MAPERDESAHGSEELAYAKEFQSFPVDNLYHLGLDTKTNNLQAMFQDVQVVCMMGSPDRAQAFAAKLTPMFGVAAPQNLAKTDRCVLYKVGKCLSISHGMGNPSCLIFLHEIAKLVWHAKVDASKLQFLRLGTSGGVGVEPGTVCLTEESCDAELKRGYEHTALGVRKRWPAKADVGLNNAIAAAFAKEQALVKATGSAEDIAKYGFQLKRGVTMATDDYYEGQGRRDGALETWYSEVEKLVFLKKAAAEGVVNIEMESTCFLFFFGRLNARATIIGAALLNRLLGDQHVIPPEKIKEYAARPQLVMLAYVKSLFKLDCKISLS